MNNRSAAWTVAHVEIIPLSSTEWRISDATKTESYGLALPGFIEKVGEKYEITRLGFPLKHPAFTSFNAAIDALSTPRTPRAQPDNTA